MGNDAQEALGAMEIYLQSLGEKEVIFVNGPATIQRGSPQTIPSTGIRYIDTQIVSMQLQGNGNLIHSLGVAIASTPTSTGQIIALDPGSDFPAESFFDVYMELTVTTAQGDLILHTEEPWHIQAEILCIPPVGTPHKHDRDTITLFTPIGEPVGFITNGSFKLEGPIFSVRPEAYLHNNSLGPLEFPNREFVGGAIAEPNPPNIGWPPIGRMIPSLLGLDYDGDNVDALSFGIDEVTPEPINYPVITFSVDPLSAAAPMTAVDFEFTTGTSFGGPDIPAPPEQRADIFYSPLNNNNTLLYDEKDPTCQNFNMTVTNVIPSGTYCPQSYNPPGWPGGDIPEDTDALEMNNIFYVGEDIDGDTLLDVLTNNVFFSIDTNSASIGLPVPDFRPPSIPVDGITSADDILMAPPGSGGFYGIFASGIIDIGLVQEDDLDALCLFDGDDPGFLDPGLDMALFSLAPGSPSLGIIGGSAAEIYFTDFTGTFMPYITAVSLGLTPDDNLDAMDCQCMVDTLQYLDFGDAPDTTYPTLLANDGARHVLDQNIYLGSLIDGEPDGQPNISATGDDFSNLSDEDGVIFLTNHQAGLDDTITVTASTSGYLNAWCDFNVDGDWADAGEQIFTDEPINGGPNILTYSIPDSAVTWLSYIRFRFSTFTGLSYTGLAQNGEVEDYFYLINDHVTVPSDTVVNSEDTCYTAVFSITIPEAGGSYVIQNGGSLIAIAGSMIAVKPGFKALSGSYASLSIGYPVCPSPSPSPYSTVPMHDDEPVVMDEEASILVYPNPTSGTVNIQFRADCWDDQIHVEVFNLVGQNILTTTVPCREDFHFDLAFYPRGIYILKLVCNNEIYIEKLVKE